MKRHVTSLLITLAVGYGLLYAFAWLVSESMMFFPPAERLEPRNPVVRIPVEDGEHVAVLHLPNPEAEFVLLYSHGNAEDLMHLEPHLYAYLQRGYEVLAYDYRGYGLSDGSPKERNTYRDIDAVYRYAVDTLGIPPERIIAYGRSIGSGPTTWLAANRKVAGLVLEAPFTSAFRVVTRIPLFPIDRYPNDRRIRDVTAPILILHGRDDTTIPFEHGERLYRLAPEPKAHLWLDHVGHTGIVMMGGKAYWDALAALTDAARQAP